MPVVSGRDPPWVASGTCVFLGEYEVFHSFLLLRMTMLYSLGWTWSPPLAEVFQTPAVRPLSRKDEMSRGRPELEGVGTLITLHPGACRYPYNALGVDLGWLTLHPGAYWRG